MSEIVAGGSTFVIATSYVVTTTTMTPATTFATYATYPERRPAYRRIAHGSYRPRDLGLTLPGVRWIHVAHCGRGEDWETPTVLGHAHLTGEMCIRDRRYVLDGARRPTEVVLHEWAHVLVGEYGHGERWAAIARRLGIKASEWASIAYDGEPELSAA